MLLPRQWLPLPMQLLLLPLLLRLLRLLLQHLMLTRLFLQLLQLLFLALCMVCGFSMRNQYQTHTSGGVFPPASRF